MALFLKDGETRQRATEGDVRPGAYLCGRHRLWHVCAADSSEVLIEDCAASKVPAEWTTARRFLCVHGPLWVVRAGSEKPEVAGSLTAAS